jgi:hypothetical protein
MIRMSHERKSSDGGSRESTGESIEMKIDEMPGRLEK